MRALRQGAVGLLILATCCLGPKARQEVLLPAMKVAWPAIVSTSIEPGMALLSDAEKVAVGAGVAAMTAALDANDLDAVTAVDWPPLAAVAMAGITARLGAGEIGPGVADSLRERVRVFGEAWMKALR